MTLLNGGAVHQLELPDTGTAGWENIFFRSRRRNKLGCMVDAYSLCRLPAAFGFAPWWIVGNQILA
jgi:hypothetical protein